MANDTDKKAQELLASLQASSGNPLEGFTPAPTQPVEDYGAMLDQSQQDQKATDEARNRASADFGTGALLMRPAKDTSPQGATNDFMSFLNNSSGNPSDGLIPGMDKSSPDSIVASQPEAGAIQDTPVDPRMAKLQSVLASLTSARQPNVKDKSNFRDDILKQLSDARAENKASLDSARATDSKVGLLNNLNKSFNQIGTGIANQAGYTKIAGSPLEVSSDLAKQAEADGANKLSGVNEKYKIQSDKEQTASSEAQRKIENNFKQQMLDLQKSKLNQDKKEQAGAGQKRLDSEFAKEYQDWTSGGQKVASTEINKLRNVIDSLKTGKVGTGGLTGMFPDQLTSKDVLSARSDVEGSVMGSLRSILGAQFTENEGKRIIKNTWNEADSTANNVNRLERLANDLEGKAAAKNNKAQYFEKAGASLKGFQSGSVAPTQSTSQSSGTVKVRDPQGNIRKIPSSKLQDALAAGGTLAE